MRNGQNKRMRGRNRGKSHNPLGRVYESNGPDVKIRGTPSHIAEKYMQLARDAHASSDPVAAENYFQHAEHYFRLIATAQEQLRQTNPYMAQNVPQGAADSREDYDDGDDDGDGAGVDQPMFGTRDPQPFVPRDAQFFPQRENQGRQQPAPQGGQQQGEERNVDRLPSFITGGSGGQPPYAPTNADAPAQGERFNRRRRRHRGPRPDMAGGHQNSSAEGGDESVQ